MRARPLVVWVLVLVAACGVYAAAQSTPASAPSPSFTVVTGEKATILLQAATGQTWRLAVSVDPRQPAVWLPIDRLDAPAAVAQWHAAEEERRTTMIVRNRQERRLSELKAQLQGWQERSSTGDSSPNATEIKHEIEELEKQLQQNSTTRP